MKLKRKTKKMKQEMEKERVDVLYNESGKPVRVQMDIDTYVWMIENIPYKKDEPAMAFVA